MGIEASYRRINFAEWDQLRHLMESSEDSNADERYEAYASIADSDELRSSDRYLSIEKDWHALHVLLTGEMSNPSEIQPFPPPLGNVVIGGTETPFDAGYGKVRFLKPEEVREVAEALIHISVHDLQSRFDPVAFTKAKVYPNPRPGGWDLEQLVSLLWIYPELVNFFRIAARGWRRGSAIIGLECSHIVDRNYDLSLTKDRITPADSSMSQSTKGQNSLNHISSFLRNASSIPCQDSSRASMIACFSYFDGLVNTRLHPGGVNHASTSPCASSAVTRSWCPEARISQGRLRHFPVEKRSRSAVSLTF